MSSPDACTTASRHSVTENGWKSTGQTTRKRPPDPGPGHRWTRGEHMPGGDATVGDRISASIAAAPDGALARREERRWGTLGGTPIAREAAGRRDGSAGRAVRSGVRWAAGGHEHGARDRLLLVQLRAGIFREAAGRAW